MKTIICVILFGISLVNCSAIRKLFDSSIEFAVEKSVMSLGHSRKFATCFAKELKSKNSFNGLKNLNPLQLAVEMPKVISNSFHARDYCRLYENFYLILFCIALLILIMISFCYLKFRR